MTMTPVVLRNGKTVARELVIAVSMTLERLIREDPILLYEAREIARNPAHRPFGNTGLKLEDLSLTQHGIMHNDVRSIIISSIEGEMLEMRLVAPFEERR